MPSHLGKLDVKSVREGEGRIPMEAALPGVSNADLTALKNWHWSEELTEDTRSAIFQIEVRSYLLQVDGLNVLIDTCCGNDKERSAPWAHRLQTPWLHNLASAGCRPGDVHLVLCTHLHADHVGWNTRLDNGRWVPTFPNARYVFSRKDFDYFGGQTREAYDREAYADSVLPVVAAGLPTSSTAITASIARSRTASGSRTPPAIRPGPSSSTPNAAARASCSRATSFITRSNSSVPISRS